MFITQEGLQRLECCFSFIPWVLEHHNCVCDVGKKCELSISD